MEEGEKYLVRAHEVPGDARRGRPWPSPLSGTGDLKRRLCTGKMTDEQFSVNPWRLTHRDETLELRPRERCRGRMSDRRR